MSVTAVAEPTTCPDLDLTLHISDPELRAELELHPAGAAQHDYALGALRIGVLALRQAQGRVDSDRIRAESERFLESLESTLTAHERTVAEQVASTLKNYFDPADGRFTERVDRLVRKDGELERLIRDQVGREDSEMARTLTAHLGLSSPLMRQLDPEASDGLLSVWSTAVGATLDEQKTQILNEFSLDNKEGALARLVSELEEHHGEIGKALEERIDEVVAEFSLDREDSALSRLVGQVERAQRQISREFSLDDERSALARMRAELLSVIESQRKANGEFQEQVLGKLAEMVIRKQEAARSTRHGQDFESHVFELVQNHSQSAGDVATPVGTTTGLIRNCKVGDILVKLCPDHAAAGARVVIEAKEQQGYQLGDALEELQRARKNRDADVGTFVFSASTAPEGLEPLARYGKDVVLVWDADDHRTDIVLNAGLSVAKALCARSRAETATEAADFETIDRAVREVEKQIGGLDEITRLSGTIQSNSGKILKRAALMRDSLVEQVETLDEAIEGLPGRAGGSAES